MAAYIGGLLSYRFSKPYFYYLVIVTTLVALFISDTLNKYTYVNFQSEDSISAVVRAIFEVIFILLLLFQLNKSNFYLVLSIFLLFLSFTFGHLYFFKGELERLVFLGNFKVFNKYIFIFILYPPLKFLANRSPLLFNKVVSIFYFILLINSLLIFVGFFLDITLLRSYPFKSYRFGFSGVIPKINEATLFYFIAISFIYYKRYIQKIKSHKDYIILLAPLLLGAKGIYLFILLLLFYHIFSKKNKILSFLAVSISSVGAIFYFFKSPDKLNYFIQQAQSMGFFSMLLSGRDNILHEYSGELLERWGIINYFFGGQDQTYRMFEMDFFDLFFFFGIVGSSFYLFLLFQTIFNLQLKKSFNLFLVITYFILAFLGGHFFASAINAFYLCILTLFIRLNLNNEHHLNC